MGNSKRVTTTSEGQRNRKRRRRNVRTAEILSSSSESSDSESSSSESEEEVAKHPTKTRGNQSVAADGEVEMRVCCALLKRNHRKLSANNAGL
jgi:hypothetical protein